MVERSLSMREVGGSMPPDSNFCCDNKKGLSMYPFPFYLSASLCVSALPHRMVRSIIQEGLWCL